MRSTSEREIVALVRGKLVPSGHGFDGRQETTVRAPDDVPRLPATDADGYYPAVEFAYASIARSVIRRRKAAGLSQAELAATAGVRTATVNRLKGGRHSPNVRTVDKIDAALRKAGV
jgi:DNA-binding XRE family transcriptional regulator